METLSQKVDAVLGNADLRCWLRYVPYHKVAAAAGVPLDEFRREMNHMSRGARFRTIRATGSDDRTHVTTCMFEPPTPTSAQMETFGDELPAHQHPQTQRVETSFDKCLRVSFEPTFDNTTRRDSTQTSFKARVFETLHIESGPLYPLPLPTNPHVLTSFFLIMALRPARPASFREAAAVAWSVPGPPAAYILLNPTLDSLMKRHISQIDLGGGGPAQGVAVSTPL
jgi:hypothetical protein